MVGVDARRIPAAGRAEPACHVSYYEADAFARWAGARLPTEAEWELAANGQESDGNFLESEPSIHSPSLTARNLRAFGDVWEWTQSPYRPTRVHARPREHSANTTRSSCATSSCFEVVRVRPRVAHPADLSKFLPPRGSLAIHGNSPGEELMINHDLDRPPRLRQYRVDRFLEDVRQGLHLPRKASPCKYLYDERGSALFDEICELDEYYLTRTELAILERHVAQMAAPSARTAS